MEQPNPFDAKLEANKHIRQSTRDALIDSVDTLDFCWAGARAVFGKLAKPEHAIALLPIALARADAERQRMQDEIAARTDAESKPPPSGSPARKTLRR